MKSNSKCFIFLFFRCVHISTAGASCRRGADTRGKAVAAQQRGSFPNGVAETYQPRGRQTTLFCVSKQGELSLTNVMEKVNN